LLVVNTLSFPRKAVVSLAPHTPLPAGESPVEAVQSDDVVRTLRVSLPGSGFVWVPYPTQETPPSVEKLPTADDLLLRNEFFEVNLSDVTGGIGQIRTYERSPNRISQQLAYRFPRERTVTIGEGEQQEQYRTYYSEMVLDSTRVLRSGSVVGEIETTGKIVDPQAREFLAGYRQVTRIWRGKPLLEVEIELDPVQLPDGNPWTNYYAVRFAWKHESAAVSRSQHHGAHVVTAERFEAPEFIELADEDFRTTILTCGLPFHRKTGPRMLDTIVLAAGESRRTFRFGVAIDEQYPLECARDLGTPPVCVPTSTGPAGGAATGWFFHVSSRNVQITRVLPMLPGEEDAADASGCRLRLMETEGRRKNITLRCFRAPTSARQHDFLGETLQTLPVEGDKVSLEVGRFEICDVELRFDA
jgi:alpha-mannosidase